MSKVPHSVFGWVSSTSDKPNMWSVYQAKFGWHKGVGLSRAYCTAKEKIALKDSGTNLCRKMEVFPEVLDAFISQPPVVVAPSKVLFNITPGL